MLGAGDLNRKIMFQRPARVGNMQGGSVKSWTDAGAAWAQMIPLRGGEALEQSVLRGTQLWKVTVRFRADVSTDWRVLFGEQPLNILTCADPDGRRAWLVMTCESGVRT